MNVPGSILEFSLNLFILHRLRNKFLQLILISLDFASWELHQFSGRIRGPMKIPKLRPAPGTRTRDLMIVRPTLYLTTTDTTILDPTVFSALLENFLPFSPSFKLSSGVSFNLGQPNICSLGKA